MQYLPQISSSSLTSHLRTELIETPINKVADRVVMALSRFFDSPFFSTNESVEQMPWPVWQGSKPLSLTHRLVRVCGEPYNRLLSHREVLKSQVISRIFALALSPLFVITGVMDAVFGLLTSVELLIRGRSEDLSSKNIQYLSGIEDSTALVYFGLLRAIYPAAQAKYETGFTRGLVDRYVVPHLDKSTRPQGLERVSSAVCGILALTSRYVDSSLGGALGVLSMFTFGQVPKLNTLAYGCLAGRGGIVKDLGRYSVKVLR